MLLIVGGAHDVEVLAAVSTLGPGRAVVLDAADLSRPGWSLSIDAPHQGRIVAGGESMAVAKLTGVLIRRLAIYQQELQHVQPSDREYVASEMTALLHWWLSVLPLPVLNRPGAGLLCGPGWRPEYWRSLAVRLGYPVVAAIRNTRPPELLPPAKTEVIVVGEAVAGDPPGDLAVRALALARAGNAQLLSASFSEDGLFLGAHSMPRLTPEVLAAVAHYMKLAP